MRTVRLQRQCKTIHEAWFCLSVLPQCTHACIPGVLPFRGGENAVSCLYCQFTAGRIVAVQTHVERGSRCCSEDVCSHSPPAEALARLQKWMFDDDHLKDYFDIRQVSELRAVVSTQTNTARTESIWGNCLEALSRLAYEGFLFLFESWVRQPACLLF